MNNENELIQKLMISKKIMDIHNKTPRNQNDNVNINIPVVEEFSSPNASYNIPQEILSEVGHTAVPKKMTQEIPTEQKIMSSKLPDEIKRLMIEHPIVQPNNMGGPTLSNELVEKASRLMGTTPIQENIQTRKQTQTNISSNVDSKMIKEMVRETMEDILRENGLIIESTTKTNEFFSFRVGEHIFEGKLTKIKKISK